MKNFISELKDKVRNTTSKIIINGQSFVGRNVSMINSQVVIDGRRVDIGEAKDIRITIEGDLGSLTLDHGIVNISGNCGDIRVGQGNVNTAADVKGEVHVDQGKVECQDVYSDVHVDMGNIKASTIHGSARTKMGNITK